MKSAVLTLVLLLPAVAAAKAEDAARLSLRGVEAYQTGRLDLARIFFERAYRQAALQGRLDWVVLSACNLFDVALETRNLEDAERWLDAARDAQGAERAVVLWKQSQLLNVRHEPEAAVGAVDSALALRPLDADIKVRMQIDRYRYEFALEDSAAWEKSFTAFRADLKTDGKKETIGLWAWANMRWRRYAAAESLWSDALDAYRAEHRPLAVGEALAYRALCLHALDRRQEALHSADLAEAVFEETGFALGRLRAQALQALLGGDAVAKSGRESDFLARESMGDDWKDLLDDYVESYPPLLGQLEHLRGRQPATP